MYVSNFCSSSSYCVLEVVSIYSSLEYRIIHSDTEHDGPSNTRDCEYDFGGASGKALPKACFRGIQVVTVTESTVGVSVSGTTKSWEKPCKLRL